ncbi:MAG: hypothetical protein A2Y41_08065 [Spirochaetes bacterium GWB1_36_13]|nr:MAG: hypothetical protein A2Y41_08065 [Spirochaetes bacterium GWB1_36_13]
MTISVLSNRFRSFASKNRNDRRSFYNLIQYITKILSVKKTCAIFLILLKEKTKKSDVYFYEVQMDDFIYFFFLVNKSLR